ncbi:DUF421 domain-containing protein [Halalkalibacterium halodurans]|uniref:BH1572 protein n=1 Tax=Halalkalibacterium halodurans (strain ATCC BAA-125 / DSM 18197 / FERM 7344 / JCM 9153 / C-125) TaxID=272558 RepID=Q9KCJ9_HALH5|nr:DUF421 domain-containing protein [Halalkalibacterium halodurans]MDY7222144.1 DUF421 domain-containing protein [Halalkalibacterium halodurans]MDY7241365.1 DUF421 domain-containing protein [Halalkalibacterium halodurans]MED4125777.1 DUF421 domain-containing protein [Halalkalibacterium halodurans]MED4173012.1 DUF421 domain-containing protein [Halalkalibacterium halodurans]BAB05291.1 BH1572 [Halalkalibacterium halodurans C-125]
MAGWLEAFIRSVCSIIVLFLVFKAYGRRSFQDVSLFQGAMIIALAGIASIGSFLLTVPFMPFFVALLLWSAVFLGAHRLQGKHGGALKFFAGQPETVVEKGKIKEDVLHKQKLTAEDFMRKLREKNIFQLSDVEWAQLETNGALTVFLKEGSYSEAASTGKQGRRQPPMTVIQNGQIVDSALQKRGVTREWLKAELEKQEVLLGNVFLAEMDQNGQLYVDLYNDDITPKPVNELPLLRESIKKAQADLAYAALTSTNRTNAKVYSRCAEAMQQVENVVSPYVR